ncbi:MAG: SUF system NifU family Fe-S cluster assembly protein [Candidatus Omnitrophica bacterium]|nr:SUF system NifU family Fe-S cluster assembly protein [Candidatus Omnitrophota bacterium]
MNENNRKELYQQVILEHNKKPKNFRQIDEATHTAEGYNPLCGDHLTVYICVNDQDIVEDIAFHGDGCAISRASASMMTAALKGKNINDVDILFDEFHRLVKGELHPDQEENHLGKLSVFSGIWQYPSRIKCASLCWHAMKGALEKKDSVSTE